MRKIKLDSVFEEYDRYDLLPENDRQLIDKAIEASQSAYAPYSHFHVGAAVMLNNGEIVMGNNQENAAYPSGLCAERVAFFQLVLNILMRTLLQSLLSPTLKVLKQVK